MPETSVDAALGRIRTIYAKWLAGEVACEDALFEIGDVLRALDQAHSGAPSSTR